MRVLQLNVMRGPNYWSSYRKKLIVMKLDLGRFEQFPTNKIDGFYERLKQALPSLHSHRCSHDEAGGFFLRVKEGTWLGHVVEHVALELQTLGGMECGFGRTRSTGQTGVYNVVFSYEIERAGKFAAQAAVDLVHAVARNEPYDVADAVNTLQRIGDRERLGPSTQSIVTEAERRNIPVKRLDNRSLIQLGQGRFQQVMRAGIAGTTSSLGIEIAGDKEHTKQLLEQAHIPVPEGLLIEDEQELTEAIEDLGFPLVIKPLDGNHGRGVTTNISSHEHALKAFRLAQAISADVIVEKYIQGNDYRLLVVNFKLVAAALRSPAMVTGDGKRTIAELIEEVNQDPRRGEGHTKVLTAITIDEATRSILQAKQLTPDSVLPQGQQLHLKDTANISTGGTATDVTDVVHPHTVFLAERAARLLDLNICGLDIIARDISEPLDSDNGAILEVNASPGFRMHLSPTHGIARNVAQPVVDMLFPKGSNGRIPVVAITGTNGKTTTTRLIAHLAKQAGHSVGFTTTDGIYINGTTVYEGDCSGPSSAETILRDPAVDFAVLECARGGILRSGLGFDQCDIGIVTNVTADHLGLRDIHTLDDLARVKIVVPRSVRESGYAILNADDDLVYGMRRELDCRIALFSMDAESERIRRHCEDDGMAAVVKDGYFVWLQGQWETRIIAVADVPLTMNGAAECMIKNVLPSILAAAISGFAAKQIAESLKSFVPSAATTPGRMNIFKFERCTVMVDYAHNAGAYSELKKYLDTVTASRKIGIVAATGDRRDEDVRDVGAYAARMFDEVIIRHDTDGRGRSNDNMTALITEGVQRVNPATPVQVISDELEALQYAMDTCPQDAFIVLCPDDVQGALNYVNKINQSNGNRAPVMESRNVQQA
jgi:cyanophycin synthetase